MSSVTGQPSVLAALSPWAYFRHSWRAVFAVTALVVIAHHRHALDPVDTYAFFLVSHFLGDPPPHARSPKIVVASIDQTSFERDYRERSPLRRKVLYEHLKAIYDLEPSVVVVDLDLSPVLPLSAPDGAARPEKTEEERESDRYQELIEDLVADAANRGTKTKTVLMTPLPMTTEAAKKARTCWISKMTEEKGAEFGDGTLPITWGVTIKHSCAPGSLAAVAYRAVLPKSSSPPSGSCLNRPHPTEVNPVFIDPSHYLAHIAKVPIAFEDPPPDTPAFTSRLNVAFHRVLQSSDGGRGVVFFGGGWGESDTHVTPVGELYGVEVHAGAYLSIANPPWPLTDLADALADIIVACIVGAVLSLLWSRYFSDALGNSPIRRERAVLWLVVLAIFTLVVTAAFVQVSLTLLRWGLWLSPVPLIVGMSIHTFVESLREARESALAGRPAGARGGPPRDRFRYLRRTVVETRPDAIVESVEETAWVATDSETAHGSPSLWRLAYQYFWVDALATYRLGESGARLAGVCQFLKRLAWLVLVAVGLVLILPRNKEALMRLLMSVVLVAILVVPAHAAETACRGLPPTLTKDDLPKWEKRAKDAGCGSFLSVIGKIMGRDVTGGRRLEKDKPFNPAAAQANVDKALRDPDVRKRIEAVRRDVPDETVRLMFEAVIFDEEGFYDAREFRIRQLRERLN